MQAPEFLQKSKDPAAWRKHARALRRAADNIWEQFSTSLSNSVIYAKQSGTDLDIESAIEDIEIAKLLYGLSLETALKAHIISSAPEEIELRITVNGLGDATHAELRNVGIPMSQGHNLLALADRAGLFSHAFAHVLKTESDTSAMKNICRDLGEVVLWRGRYTVTGARLTAM